MNTNDHGRKEPSLSDLEAFERLLRESLNDEPVAKHPAPTPAAAPPMTKADHDAMAELTRLIEQPLDFALPEAAQRPSAPQTEPLAAEAAPDPVVAAPEPAFAPDAFEPAPLPALPEPADLHTHVDAEFSHGWPAPPHVETHLAPLPPLPEPAIAAVTPEDPLAAFEEELRRFDASRLGQPVAPVPVVAEVPPAPALPDPAFAEPAAFETPDIQAQPAPSPAFHHEAYHEPTVYVPRPAPAAYAEPALATDAAAQPKSSALDAVEERLAAEAAAASYAPDEQQSSDVRRSRGVFMALGGLAVAGLAVVGGVFAFGGSKKATTGDDVPVIAAKKEPTKEKPADPGGVEIPNQNAQILSGKDVIKDTGPAKQVVNTTEQPLDLKEVTRRESVRIVTPNPFQQGNQTPVVESPNAAQKPADVEPRRVTSVRVPTGGETAGSGAGGAGIGAAAAAAGAGAAALAANAAAPKPPKVEAPKAEAPRVIATAPGDAAKSEARPPKKTETPKKAETPKADAAKATTPAKVANASATPKAKTPEKASPQRSANAPLQLNTDQPKAKASPAAGASGTYAVQLASRPTESDARAAAGTLGSKYSAQLGGKATRVTSGEANGQTVYRVRVGGYSQQAATDACNRIKAAGGSCFIAKQ